MCSFMGGRVLLLWFKLEGCKSGLSEVELEAGGCAVGGG